MILNLCVLLTHAAHYTAGQGFVSCKDDLFCPVSGVRRSRKIASAVSAKKTQNHCSAFFTLLLPTLFILFVPYFNLHCTPSDVEVESLGAGRGDGGGGAGGLCCCDT